jgi:hypothetical protein
MPWNVTSMIFVVLSSLLLAGIASRGVLLSISLIPTFFLVLWLFNYAFEVLDHAANGRTAAPIASVEVLSPFQWRPLVIAASCFLIVGLAPKLRATGNLIVILLVLVSPASIATMAVGDGALHAANPFTLWRITAAMGAYYLLVLAVMVLFAALAVTLQAAHLWPFVRYVLLEIGILTVFAVLGSSVFLRRVQIGFDPSSSPERRMERDVGEHQRQLDGILDEAYGHARLKDYERAASIIKRWLSNTDDGGIPDNVEVILGRVRGWGDPAAFECIERAIGTSAGNKARQPARH